MLMQDTEAQQLLLDILNQAEERPMTFQFITSWREFSFYQQKTYGTKIVIRTLKSAMKKLFKSYCREVSEGTADVNTLFAYIRLRDVIAFYEEELDTLQRMLDDYDNYLGQGNFWYSFLGGERIQPWNTL
jgi:hypothetical protein